MKLYRILFIILLSSCAMSSPYEEWWKIRDSKDLFIRNENYELIDDICQQIYSSIDCHIDTRNGILAEIWQTADTTLSTRSGDCEDKAILMLAYIYKLTGRKGNLISIKFADDLWYVFHIIVEYEGRYLDPAFNAEYENVNVIQRYLFSDLGWYISIWR